MLSFNLFLDGAESMVPHDIVHEFRKEQPYPTPKNAIRDAGCFFVVERRVNREPAVPVFCGYDVEDQFSMIYQPLVEFI